MRAYNTRALAVALSLLLVLPVVAGGIGVVGAQQQNSSSNQTATPTATATPVGDTAPGSAETARITPIRFGESWLGVQVAEPDAAYNTTGPFAAFSLTEPLEAVRISQQGANAELLNGGQTVMVRYKDDAAPRPDQPALYTLELYYADGTESEITLWASGTDVSVEAAELQEYRALIYDMRGDARDNGYQDSPEGVRSHYSDVQERAQLLDNLFVEKAVQLVGSALSWFSNPLGIAVTLILVAVGSYYRLSRRGYTLDIMSNDTGKAQRMRERLRLTYKQNQQTADEERLSEVPQIGDMSEVYWRDSQGVSTVYQLAELARAGKTVKKDGELTREHHGVSDLNADSLDKSWLETVAGGGRSRIASYDIALSHMKTACERMMSSYGMGHIYRDTYEELVELIDARQEVVREGAIDGVEGPSGSSGAAAGGD